tara:strand:+ start:743 stop:1822 length:1080 start_codon:yes stop_codon:yes gene_type:complete
MKKIGFLLQSMHHLKYWIPLINKLNKLNYKSILYFSKGSYKSSNDNQDPFLHTKLLSNLSENNDFELKNRNELNNEISLLITSEGPKNIPASKNYKVITFQYCTNYLFVIHKFINEVDYYVFESNKNTIINEHYNTYNSIMDSIIKNDKKNKFLGSPKFFYDGFNKKEIITKYGLNINEKYIFFFLPVAKNLNLSYNNIPEKFFNQLNLIIDYFISKEYKIILKTRNKTTYKNTEIDNKKHTYYFEDIFFYPSTSLELIYISDIVMNFNSSGSIEALYLEKPILNYEYSKNHRHVDFNNMLTERCQSFKCFNDVSKLNENFNNIISQDNNKIIKDFKEIYFVKNSEKKLLEFIIEQINN